ncbi:hypothetical protein RGQ15_12100 [Paracoccus sp. MBLB3053]|uniref:Antifreeze glycopeptide n=1 Tax=Paracoccus aurantius TaxID=3073814 RepID=A0ABU2HTD4_9RHOB|nr:hypothetical protein [Paracoccus sp. MBLB3053]MDS9468308.1 hypothetical protein [Paracoccus sp. MBLB3053]
MSSTEIIRRAVAPLVTAFAITVQPAVARPPLSASDWLSGSIRQPDNISAWRPREPTRPPGSNSSVAKSGAVEPVGVTRLGEGNPDGKGTVSPRAAGLPQDLWGDSDSHTLARLVLASDPRLPALRRLERRILAAQLDPPKAEQGGEGELFLARVDKLLDMGATGAAEELLQTAGSADPQRFRRLFDIALLSNNEAQACDIMDRTPGVAPSFPARIFCLALGGDWAAAALVFHGADTAGLINPQMATLLAHFLDDAYSDQEEVITPPQVVTPLDLRLHEAIGQPLPSASLPLAFALADLDENGGWKARLDAAERLARAGAIPASQLRRIYEEQSPAASGGAWDRAAAIQELDLALTARDVEGVATSLPPAFNAMVRAGLGPAMADMIGAEVGALPLDGTAGQMARWLALEAGQWQVVQSTPADIPEFDLWLLDFASGLAGRTPPNGNGSDRAEILLQAFGANSTVPKPAADLIDDNRSGEALLMAMADVDAGLEGDLPRAAQGLRVLRALDQGEIARQAAIELILAPVLLATHSGVDSGVSP